jgi:hypothetical protein
MTNGLCPRRTPVLAPDLAAITLSLRLLYRR